MPKMPGFKATVTGGAKLNAFLNQAKRAQALSVRKMSVGFHDTDPAGIAAINEFGSPGKDYIPERPFFRSSFPEIMARARAILRRNVRLPRSLVSIATAGEIGAASVDAIRDSMRRFRSPGNAPFTQKKKGFDDPLVESGKLPRAVGYKIEG